MLKLALLFLIAVTACSAQVTRANYKTTGCSATATVPSAIYYIQQASTQCLTTGTIYDFGTDTARLFSCSGDQVIYASCTDGGCSNCTATTTPAGTNVCYAWKTNDHTDTLTCGPALPATPVDIPLVSQFDGPDCGGALQYSGVYGDSYCLDSGLKYACNQTYFVRYNCSQATGGVCGGCVAVEEIPLTSGSSFCSGYSRYMCLNSTNTVVNTTAAAGSTTTGGASETTTGSSAQTTTGGASSASTTGSASNPTTASGTNTNTNTNTNTGAGASSSASTVIASLAVVVVALIATTAL